jgi:tetratricopeptide (TPR) repeat protein
VLQESAGLMVIAAAPTVFGEIANSQAPFHDAFCRHVLEELQPEEMIDLVRVRLDLELEAPDLDEQRRKRLSILKEDFAARTPKLRGLLVLTGGLPRFGHILFELLVDTDLKNAQATLARFLDAQTPYFQARLDPRLVPEAELAALEVLAAAEGPLAPSEVARRLRGRSTPAALTYLRRLIDRGLVRKRGDSRKNVRYDISEPLFRVWRRFRLGRAEQEQVLALAEFVAALFTPTELLAERSSLVGRDDASLRLRLVEAALACCAAPSYREAKEPSTPAGREVAKVIEDAWAADIHGSSDKAYELSGRAIELLRHSADRRALSHHLATHAHFASRANRPEDALRAAEEGEAISLELGDDHERVHCLTHRVGALNELGRFQEALAVLDSQDALLATLGNDHERAFCLHNRARTLSLLDRYNDALTAQQTAEALLGNAGPAEMRAQWQGLRGFLLSKTNHNEEALSALAEAKKMFSEIGDDARMANCDESRGDILVDMGRNEEALSSYQSAEELYTRTGNDHGRAHCLLSRGWLLFVRKRYRAARPLLEEAKNLLTEVGDEVCRASSVEILGRIACANGEWKLGLELLQAAHASFGHTSRQATANEVGGAMLGELSRALMTMPPSDRDKWLVGVAPLARHVADDETVRANLVSLAVSLLRELGPARAVSALSRFEENLPASHSTLLQPVRLAAQIMAKELPATLPGESEETSRAVREVLAMLKRNAQGMVPKRRPGEPKKAGTTSGRATQRKRKPKRQRGGSTA